MANLKSQTVFKLVGVYLGALALIALVLLILSPHSEDTVQHEYGQAATVTAPGGGEALVVAGPPLTRLDPAGTEMRCSLVSVTNTGDTDWELNSRDWTLEGPNDTTEIFSFTTAEAPGLISGSLSPRAGVSGDVCFPLSDIPGEYTLSYRPGQNPEAEYSWGEKPL